MSLLEIQNLSVRFGDDGAPPVVDGLDLSVDKGEVLAIAGESLKRLGLTLQFSAMSPSGLRSDILVPDHEVAAARP